MSRILKTTSPATSSAIANTVRKVELLIWGARLVYPQAARNLDHWLSGNGRAMKIPVHDFMSQLFVIQHLRLAHRPRFIDGARKRLASGEVIRGRPFEMSFYDSVTAPRHSDWYYAFGGFQVESHVETDVEIENSLTGNLTFLTWSSRMRPYEYHWRPGTQFSIPFVGQVTGDEMLALERAGKGRPFTYSSDWAAITDPEVIAPISIVLSSLAR
jgi:hypothetical protein